MKYYGKAQETAQMILNAFEQPQTLPGAIAPMFLKNENGTPCRKWSWSNQLLVALAGTMDARGIRQWNECGRRVKAGARAFQILVPVTIKKAENSTETSPEVDQKDRVAVIGFKAAPVFRMEDTHGAPLDYADQNQAFLDALPLAEVAQSWGITVNSFSGEKANCYGLFSANGSIALGVSNLSTWCHELIHAADHKLVGLKGGQRLDQEIVAEFGGAIMLKMLGHDHDSDLGGCYSYCKSYADKEGKALVSVCIELLNRTCNAVALVMEHARETSAPAV